MDGTAAVPLIAGKNDSALSGKLEGALPIPSGVLKKIIVENGRRKTVHIGDLMVHEYTCNKLYFLETGIWALKLHNNCIFEHLKEGGVLGIQNIFKTNSPIVSIECIEPSIYYECAINHVMSQLKNWEVALAIAENVAWHQQQTSKYLEAITAKDAYSKVKFTIEWLEDQSGLNMKTIPLAKFICERTGLSKGHVYSILKNLKQGGYIEMAGGYLYRIYKRLPNGY